MNKKHKSNKTGSKHRQKDYTENQSFKKWVVVQRHAIDLFGLLHDLFASWTLFQKSVEWFFIKFSFLLTHSSSHWNNGFFYPLLYCWLAHPCFTHSFYKSFNASSDWVTGKWSKTNGQSNLQIVSTVPGSWRESKQNTKMYQQRHPTGKDDWNAERTSGLPPEGCAKCWVVHYHGTDTIAVQKGWQCQVDLKVPKYGCRCTQLVLCLLGL